VKSEDRKRAALEGKLFVSGKRTIAKAIHTVFSENADPGRGVMQARRLRGTEGGGERFEERTIFRKERGNPLAEGLETGRVPKMKTGGNFAKGFRKTAVAN